MAKKGRSRSGSLYRRWGGKEYAIDDKEALGEGVIWLRYMVDGKRLKKSLGTSDINEAQQKQRDLMAPLLYADGKEALAQHTLKLAQAQQTLDDAVQAQNPPLAIGDAWEAYLKSSERPDTGEATLKYYAGYWSKFVRWLTKDEPQLEYLCHITSTMARNYAATLNNPKVSPNTYNKHVGFLKLLFRTLEEPGRMEENPFERIRKKKLKTNVRRELTIAELTDLLKKAEGELQTLFILGTFTGLRLGDCCTLKWSEVDLDRGLIRRIPQKTASRSNKPVVIGIPTALHAKLIETPKTKRKGYVVTKFSELYNYRNTSGKPTRQPEITKEIQAHFEACEIQTHKDGTGKTKEYEDALQAWVDAGRKGKRPEYKRAVVEVGFHSLRHTYVSLHAERGTSQAVIQAVVGHGNPAMTAHYTHIGDEAARQAAGMLTIGEKDTQTGRGPLPEWVAEQLKKMTAKNWKKVRDELLAGSQT